MVEIKGAGSGPSSEAGALLSEVPRNTITVHWNDIPPQNNVALEKALAAIEAVQSPLRRGSLQWQAGYGFIQSDKDGRFFVHGTQIITAIHAQPAMPGQLQQTKLNMGKRKGDPIEKPGTTLWYNSTSIEKGPKGRRIRENPPAVTYTEAAHAQLTAVRTDLQSQVARDKEQAAEKCKGNTELLALVNQMPELPEALQTSLAMGEAVPGEVTVSVGDQVTRLTVREQPPHVLAHKDGIQPPRITRQFVVKADMPTGHATIELAADVQGWRGFTIPTTPGSIQLEKDHLYIALAVTTPSAVLQQVEVKIPAQGETPVFDAAVSGSVVQKVRGDTPFGPVHVDYPVYVPPRVGVDGQYTLAQRRSPVGDFDITQLQLASDARFFVRQSDSLANTEKNTIPETEPTVEGISLAARPLVEYDDKKNDEKHYGGSENQRQILAGCITLEIPQLPPDPQPERRDLVFPYDITTFSTLNPEAILEIVTARLDAGVARYKRLLQAIPEGNREAVKQVHPQAYAAIERRIAYGEQLKQKIAAYLKERIEKKTDLVVVPDDMQIPAGVAYGYTIVSQNPDGSWTADTPNEVSLKKRIRPLEYTPEELAQAVEKNDMQVVSKVVRVVSSSEAAAMDTTSLQVLPSAFVLKNDGITTVSALQVQSMNPEADSGLAQKSLAEILAEITTLDQQMLPESEESQKKELTVRRAVQMLRRAFDPKVAVTLTTTKAVEVDIRPSQADPEERKRGSQTIGQDTVSFHVIEKTEAPEASPTLCFYKSSGEYHFIAPHRVAPDRTKFRTILEATDRRMRLVETVANYVSFAVHDPEQYGIVPEQLPALRRVVQLARAVLQKNIQQYFEELESARGDHDVVFFGVAEPPKAAPAKKVVAEVVKPTASESAGSHITKYREIAAKSAEERTEIIANPQHPDWGVAVIASLQTAEGMATYVLHEAQRNFFALDSAFLKLQLEVTALPADDPAKTEMQTVIGAAEKLRTMRGENKNLPKGVPEDVRRRFLEKIFTIQATGLAFHIEVNKLKKELGISS